MLIHMWILVVIVISSVWDVYEKIFSKVTNVKTTDIC